MQTELSVRRKAHADFSSIDDTTDNKNSTSKPTYNGSDGEFAMKVAT